MAALCIWMNGEKVGVWERTRSGKDSFTYEAEWVNGPSYQPLSISMPVTPGLKVTGELVANYFDNLLPDTPEIRDRLSKRFSVKDKDAFALLEAIGRDCVGAVQILPVEVEPSANSTFPARLLKEEDVAAHLSGIGSVFGSLDVDEEFRISIAGAQEKTALLSLDGAWFMPEGTTPTTHILKPQIGMTPGRNLDFTKSVQNEWLCNKILKELGFSVANTEIKIFGTHTVLSVERFDRYWSGGEIYRLPQEDLCQALGYPSSRKYETDGRRQSGPGMVECLSVLRKSRCSKEDCSTFVKAQLVFWILAAIDGHSKNFSIYIGSGGEFNLTPLYDVISAWPNIGHGDGKIELQKVNMAMGVPTSSGRQRKLNLIQSRHWRRLAESLSIDGLWVDMVKMVENLDNALAAVAEILPEDFPRDFAEQIFNGARYHARRFLQAI